jgi:hypothetical protein
MRNLYYLCTAVDRVLLYNIGLKFLFGGFIYYHYLCIVDLREIDCRRNKTKNLFGGFKKIAYLCITNLKIGDTYYGNEN